MISVAEQVRGGNLSERVPAGLELDEVARLGLSFNKMLDELVEAASSSCMRICRSTGGGNLPKRFSAVCHPA